MHITTTRMEVRIMELEDTVKLMAAADKADEMQTVQTVEEKK